MILVEEVIVFQLVKKYLVSYGTQSFITVSQEPAAVGYFRPMLLCKPKMVFETVRPDLC
jgi:hypothetical protein